MATKIKIVTRDAENNFCYLCNLKIRVGNAYEWFRVGRLYAVRHPTCLPMSSQS